jgi:hypothetical protein
MMGLMSSSFGDMRAGDELILKKKGSKVQCQATGWSLAGIRIHRLRCGVTTIWVTDFSWRRVSSIGRVKVTSPT